MSSFAARLLSIVVLCALIPARAQAQAAEPAPSSTGLGSADTLSHTLQARRFLAGRTTPDGASPAAALGAARAQSFAMTPARALRSDQAGPRLTPLSTAWTAVGPKQILSQRYGLVTGRVTSIAFDPADTTGNTVYLGTTGGGVWKSTNAAAASGAVTFVPLTDQLPVFSANAGTTAIPSLSIGAVSVGSYNGQSVLLAGTGDPNDALDSYYGEGILRSADGGLTWTLIQQSHDGIAGNHKFTGLGVAGFAWDPQSPGLVVAALSQSAEGALVNAPDTTNSVMGLYYSTDGGQTWQMATLEDNGLIFQKPLPSGANFGGNAVTSVVWSPNRGRFYAAIRYHGYYESVDGITWSRTLHQPGTGLTTTACPANPNTTGSTACPIFRGALALEPATGDLFALTVDAGNLDQGLWQDVCGGNGGPCTTNPIVFGTRLPSSALESGAGSTAIAQADYNLALAAVHSGTDTLLFTGTTDLFRCTLSSGCIPLRNTTNATDGCAAPAQVAPAQHAIAVLAGAGTAGAPMLLLGNDGGLWRSMDGVNQQATPCSPDDASHFQNLNGGLGSLAEIVDFAQNPIDSATLLASVGANGTAASTPSSASGPWAQLASGQGGSVAIDPADPANWYLSIKAGVSLRWCGNGAACTAADFSGAPTLGYAQVANDSSLITPPILLDPALTTDVLVGTCRVWRGPAQDGTGWPGPNAISPMFTGAQNAACRSPSNGMVRSLAAAGPPSGSGSAQNAGSTVLYAGMAGTQDGGSSAGGQLFATYSGATASSSTAWTNLAASPVTNDASDAGVFNPAGFDVSSVTADPHDATGKTVYATIMGFAGNGTSAPHVYRSSDGGAHWANISSNLPNAPANALVVDPNDANTVYLAMDTGVYVASAITTCASTNCWSLFGTGLPNAPVVSLQAAASLPTGDGRNGELRAGTYGRGIWQIPLLSATAGILPAISLSPAALSFASQPASTASPAQTITVTNTGVAPLTISQVTITGDFSQTTTCSSATPIAPGGSCSVSIVFLPSASGTRTGVLTLYGNVQGGQATATLSGTGTPPAAIVLTPVLVTFPQTSVGATSATQNITISNTGGTTATLGTPTLSGDFILTANTCAATLAPGVGCTVSVGFRPTASGSRTGTLTVTGSTGTQAASLTGTGVLPATDALAPLSLAFGAQQITTSSAAQSVTLTNSGDQALQLIAAQITSGDFTVVNGCGNSLNGHASCTLQVAYVPRTVGPETGLLTVSDQYRSQTVTLSGTGVAPPGVSLTPLGPVGFAATGVGLTSAPQTVTLTNNGGLPLSIQNTSITGDFSILPASNTCAATLAPAAICTLQVVFSPTAAGSRTGTLSFTDNAAGSPQSLTLTGTGIDFTLAPDGATSATISSGSSATYALLLNSLPGLPGTVTFTCAPVPANATCTVAPATTPLGATTVIEVTVNTAASSAQLTRPLGPARTGPSRTLAWLAAFFPVGLVAARRRRPRHLLLALGLILLAGCSAARTIPVSAPGGSGGSSSSTTAPGTYTLNVTGTSTGLIRTVNLTLTVQ